MPRILFTHKIKSTHSEELKKARFEFESIPLIKTKSIDFNVNDVKAALPDAWLFTSKKAVRSVAKQIQDLSVPEFVFAVGSSTKDKLDELGISAITPSTFTSKRLAQKIAEYPVSKCVHFCGNLTKADFLEELKGHNCTVTKVRSYETKLTPQKINVSRFDAVVFMSPSAFDAFCEENDPNELKTVFCIGSTTAESVRSSYKRLIVTPDNFTFSDLVETINQKYKNVIS
jgi:uroporphyrinogen-III synthase